MKIALEERTAETVAIYFRKTNTPPIRKTLPQKAKTIEEAIVDYKTNLKKIILSWWRNLWKKAFPLNILNFIDKMISLMHAAFPCKPA